MKSIAVFCGSRMGSSNIFARQASDLGKAMAKRDITLIYGGASVGIMGTIADAVMQNGGKVIGIMPDFLEQREISHSHVSELFIVESMHERKAKMAELAEGFIALPGGPGTLEEFFEIYTWAQLGLHQKPLGILNTAGYYDPLLALFNQMLSKEFLDAKFEGLALVNQDPAELLNHMASHETPSVKSYIRDPDQT